MLEVARYRCLENSIEVVLNSPEFLLKNVYKGL